MPQIARRLQQLWFGPGGIGEVIRIALPMAASTGCVSLSLFTDRTLLYEHNPVEMAASMAAGNMFWTLVCFPLGVVGMTSAFVSQYLGSHRREEVGRLMFQAFWLSVVAGGLAFLLYPFAEQFFEFTGQNERLIPYEATYLRVLLLAGMAVILESALSGFFSGTHRPGIILAVNAASTVINIVLDLLLIFGWCGFPEWGIYGAGLATVISLWFKVFAYAWIMSLGDQPKEFGLVEGMRFDWSLTRRFMLFSFPAGIQHMMEAGSFLVIILQIGQISEQALAATTIAINFNMLAFIPLIGVSVAASVLVGYHLTEHGKSLALRATRSALVVGGSYALLCAAIYLFMPGALLSLYGGSHDVSLNAQVLVVASFLLKFVAAYCVFDAMQIILAGALRGAGDTWFVLGAASICSCVMLAGGVFLEPGSAEKQLTWWWWIITLWVISLAACNTARLLFGDWSSRRLVESEVVVLP